MNVYIRILFSILVLTLAACGGGKARLNVTTQKIEGATPEVVFGDAGLTGATNEDGRAYTSYLSGEGKDEVEKQITVNPETEAFAKQLLSAQSEINGNKLTVLARWRGLEKPLIFSGELQSKDGFLMGQLADSSGQRADLKLKATCADLACSSITAFIEDSQNHRALMYLNKKERPMTLLIPEEEVQKFEKLPQETKQAIQSIKNTNGFIHTSSEVKPGRSYLEIVDPKDGGKITSELLRTSDAPVTVSVQGGSFEKAGKIELVGNTEEGDVVYKITNKIDPTQSPATTQEEEDKNTVTVFFQTPLKELPQPVIPQIPKPSVPILPLTPKKPAPPKSDGGGGFIHTSINPHPGKDLNLDLPGLDSTTGFTHRLTNQIVKDAENGMVQDFIKSFYIPKNKPGSEDFYGFPKTKIKQARGDAKLAKFLDIYDQSKQPNPTGVAADVKNAASVLRSNDLPSWILTLGFIESEFNKFAVSDRGAKGFWQFMPETAVTYGLKVDDNIDQRTDTIRSTKAASIYLNTLLKRYNDNLKFALAAYNWGEGRVDKLVKDENTSVTNAYKYSKDFFDVIRVKMVPIQTQGHVMKIIAGTICGFEPGDCGFDEKKSLDLY